MGKKYRHVAFANTTKAALEHAQLHEQQHHDGTPTCAVEPVEGAKRYHVYCWKCRRAHEAEPPEAEPPEAGEENIHWDEFDRPFIPRR